MNESAASINGGTVADNPVEIETEGTLAGLRFDNRFTRELPADPIEGPGTRQVRHAAFSRVKPALTAGPEIIAWSKELSDQLGLDAAAWSGSAAALAFTGNGLLPGSDPYAANYGGHQFGNWAGQLGDGRAIALGEVIDVDGAHQTLQLKGAGPTAYSRRADGLAVLRSSIREYLCSEAMHHLGVPTTRALSLGLTGDAVVRDMFYDGNAAPEPGAVVCRVAPSFLRFGTYQLPASRGDIDDLRTLADFTIRHYFADLLPADGTPTPETYAAWFAEVCRTSCDLVIHWMRVGFVHGVMNTDNMSIHGLTIDYGPYGWLDDYNPEWTPNTTDAGGRRYRYGHQPQITQWNLLQLANALYPLIDDAEPLEASLNGFVSQFQDGHRAMMLAKLGLVAGDPDEDETLIGDLLRILTLTETDMTIFHRRLGRADLGAANDDAESTAAAVLGPDGIGPAYYDLDGADDEARTGMVAWVNRYRERLAAEGRPAEERLAAMDRVNPMYVFRNYLAQEAIDAAEAGDHSRIGALAEVLRHPYEEQTGAEAFAARRPEWARSRPGCSMLSCSS